MQGRTRPMPEIDLPENVKPMGRRLPPDRQNWQSPGTELPPAGPPANPRRAAHQTNPCTAIVAGCTLNTSEVIAMTLAYMPGFGNDFETESLPGALPQGQTLPSAAYGLGAAFGLALHGPRGTNERSWLSHPSIGASRQPLQESGGTTLEDGSFVRRA